MVGTGTSVVTVEVTVKVSVVSCPVTVVVAVVVKIDDAGPAVPEEVALPPPPLEEGDGAYEVVAWLGFESAFQTWFEL